MAAMLLDTLLDDRIDDVCLPLKDSTLRHYRRCIEHYGRWLERPAAITDLKAKPLMGWAQSVVESGRSPHTAAQQLKQLRAIWQWAWQERIVDRPPPRGLRVRTERVHPDEWTADQLDALFAAAARQSGWIGPHRACDWWLGVLWWSYNTGARSGETWQLRPEMIDFERGVAAVPASIRKESRVPMQWWLTKECRDVLSRVAERSEGLLFTAPWSYQSCVYRHYRKLLADAELPMDRRHGLQKMRRTVATRIKIRGGDPGLWLGHAPRTVAQEHYEDRWAIQTALRHIWPTDCLGDSQPPPGTQRALFMP